MARIGGVDYERGARERLQESYLLLQHRLFGGSIYLAGRAVEGMLRAVLWKSDPAYATGQKALDVGHDLRKLIKLVGNLGLLRDKAIRYTMTEDVQRISRLWFNNMRFLGTAKIEARWREIGEVDKRRTIKRASEEFYNACSSVFKRCEAL